MSELIDHTPHTMPGFGVDNKQLFSLLATCLGNTSKVLLASITQCQRKRDGRSAYLDLVTHYMGSTKWEKKADSHKDTEQEEL